MVPFDLVEPASLGEAVRLLDPDDPAVRPIGGGTALMLMMKSGFFRPKRLVSLRHAGERLRRIGVGAGGELRIGAMVRLSALERSAEVGSRFPVMAETLKTLSNRRVRNVATLGGHVAHADPHTDLPPVLIALNAQAVIAGPEGERTLPVEGLATGYYETALDGNELIAEIVVPPLGAARAAYWKCTTRAADDWPALGVAVSLGIEGSVIRKAGIVVSAATETPTRLTRAEAALNGRDVGEALLREAGRAAAEQAVVVADARGSASYKKRLIEVCVVRALKKALGEGGGP
jgi:carbon-monoxide dehydrogenase medium subunit